MPMRGELPTAAARTYDRESLGETFWSSALMIASDRDLHAVVAFALIGLLLTINVVQATPISDRRSRSSQYFPDVSFLRRPAANSRQVHRRDAAVDKKIGAPDEG
jgi:hypothetical protein